MPTREMPGASLFNVSSIFPKIENSMSENPVTLRPGRARLSTAPDAIGSVVNATTIGIERVNFVRTGSVASHAGVGPFGTLPRSRNLHIFGAYGSRRIGLLRSG